MKKSELFLDSRRRQLAERDLKGAQRRQLKKANRARLRGYVRQERQALLNRLINPATADETYLTWFWFNHFNIFWKKRAVGAAIPSYLSDTIRPHQSGRFVDLLHAVMLSPAMLFYLDNVKNIKGKINENYARELLELHSLGVDGGYSQQDIQEVARVLTGFGLVPIKPRPMSKKWTKLSVRQGGFLFNARGHDFGTKRVLNHTITGTGFTEAKALAEILAAHPSTARFLSRKLCHFYWGDQVPSDVLNRAIAVYNKTDGHIGSVIQSIRGSARPVSGVGTFKDPMRWMVSSLRLVSNGQPIKNARAIESYLLSLGQPIFGYATPDGYSLLGRDWQSPGQMIQRFDIADAISNTLRRTFGSKHTAEKVLASANVSNQLASMSERSVKIVRQASSAEEKLALILSSPDFMYWNSA